MDSNGLAQNLLAQTAVRFWAKVDKTGECWLWTGAKSPRGYGLVSVASHNYGAHLVSLMLSGRSVTPGMDQDHLCNNKLCVRPEHLEEVTRSENVRRSYQYRRTGVSLAKDRVEVPTTE